RAGVTRHRSAGNDVTVQVPRLCGGGVDRSRLLLTLRGRTPYKRGAHEPCYVAQPCYVAHEPCYVTRARHNQKFGRFGSCEMSNLDAIYEAMLCPVCGFQLDFKPWNGASASDEICPSCGIQFGYDDAGPDDRRTYYSQWRQNWQAGGSLWWS